MPYKLVLKVLLNSAKWRFWRFLVATLATNVGRPRFFISVTIIDEILHNLGAILAYSTILIKGDNEIRIKTCVLPYHGFTLFFVYSGQDLQNPMTDFDETLHTYNTNDIRKVLMLVNYR